MRFGRTRSISTRLTFMNMLVSGAALSLACAGFFIYDQVTFRQSLVRTLSVQAQIVGSNTVSAILFNDSEAASDTLSALKSFPHVVSAGILTTEQRPFAAYNRAAGRDILNLLPALPDENNESYWFKNDRAVLVRKIFSDGELVGYVYIGADLRELDARLWRYAFISAAMLLISLLFALLISAGFRRSVAQPIVGLAETAQSVTRDRDYSVRMLPTGQQDELAVLIDSFNEMLKQIQQRDRALQNSYDLLEERVSDRTRDLVSANEELEAFSYSVSHDLRGPLDAITGFAYVVLSTQGGKLDADGQEALRSIRAAARRMSQLIDDLLNLSRVTTSVMHREKVDLAVFARSIMEELCRATPGRHVEFSAPDVADANADARLIRIVMDNLLRNAWKYTSHHEHARIEFGCDKEGGGIVYFVKDDGSGFDPRASERLFQPFHRLHSSAQFPGNGIGLATVRRIVQRHGGEVWAEAAVEKGATFYFTLESRYANPQQAM